MTTSKDEVRDEFGRLGVHNEQLENIIRQLSREIVAHCVRETPPDESLNALIANVNSLTLQVIQHLIYFVTTDQHEVKQALVALERLNAMEADGRL